MVWGSRALGLIIGAVLLSLLVFLELIPLIGPPGGAPAGDGPSHHAVFGRLFAELPAWVKVWMKFQDVIIAGSLFFILWRKEAQIYALGIIANHIMLFALLPRIPIEKVSLGFAALTHFCWIIPMIVLLRAWPRLKKSTGYGTWVTIAIAQLIFSLTMDVPQGLQFLVSLF